MKYMKFFENYIPSSHIEWINYLISLNVFNSMEVVSYLEETFGTKENKLYKKNINNSIFFSKNEQFTDLILEKFNNELWIRSIIHRIFIKEFNINIQQSGELIRLYIQEVYGYKFHKNNVFFGHIHFNNA
jgi:hypothetical protein